MQGFVALAHGGVHLIPELPAMDVERPLEAVQFHDSVEAWLSVLNRLQYVPRTVTR